LAKINQLKVDVYDTYSGQYELAQARWLEVNSDLSNLRCLESPKFEKEYDLIIVATNSDVRLEVIDVLLEHQVRGVLVLEKVLFTSLEDYNRAASLSALDKSVVVNHARRMYPVFKDLKNLLGSLETLELIVEGANWGLACNGLHFADLYFYLADVSESIELEFSNLAISNNVRKGFHEFFGSFELITRKGRALITSQESDFSGIVLKGKTEEKIFIVSQNKTLQLDLFTKDGSKEFSKEYDLKFQSELTTEIYRQVISDSEIALPDFMNSVKLHAKFYEELKTASEPLIRKELKIT
jgi:hypothetical protein